MLGWWWRQICGAHPCSVCRHRLNEGETFYTPRNPDDEQVAMIEQLFRVDPLAEFAVCQRCMNCVEFNTWLAWQQVDRDERERTEEKAIWRKQGF
jgi:hypothetical protein